MTRLALTALLAAVAHDGGYLGSGNHHVFTCVRP